MNIELLKKLVRLATNNPNENEANLAAIKVCKMLLEDDFKCISMIQQFPPNPLWGMRGNQENWNQSAQARNQDAYKDFLDLFKKMNQNKK